MHTVSQALILSSTTEHAAVIIHGPHGCGKTSNAAALAALFRKSQILDNWKLGDHLPLDAVCLTNDARIHGLQQFQMPGLPPSEVFEFFDLVREIEALECTA